MQSGFCPLNPWLAKFPASGPILQSPSHGTQLLFAFVGKKLRWDLRVQWDVSC